MKVSLKTKIILILLVIIIIPISVLGIMSYSKAKDVFIEGFNLENEKIIEHTNNYFLTNFMDNIENKVKYWSEHELWQSEKLTNQSKYKIRREWNSFMKINSDLLWIYFGSKNGEFMISPKNAPIPKGFDPRKRVWYLDAIKANNKVVWTEPYKDAITGKITVTAAIGVNNLKTKEMIGVIGIDFSLDRFSNAISSINKSFDGFTIITDGKGIVLNHPNKNYLGRNISDITWIQKIKQSKNGKLLSKLETALDFDEYSSSKYYINYTTVSKTGWKVISLISAASMEKIIGPIRDRTISVAIISIIISFIVGFILSDYITKKLKRIIVYMSEVEKGNLNVKSYYDGNDEFGILNKKFNSMAQNISKMMNEAKQLSYIDGLTKLYNHNYLYEKLDEEIKRANRYGGKLSIIMIDVDNFKEINDTYGHQAGDKSLLVIANTIKSTLREVDIVGRYGGEEFLALLPGIEMNACLIAAERIRKNVENLIWEYAERQLTVSIGIVELNDEDAIALVGKADSLLYKAKNNGKNRVEM